MSRFDQCLKFILEVEGGYCNDPSDRGGATNCGVTQSVYDDYRVSAGRNQQPVVGISADEVADIYRKRYWQVVRGDQLPCPVDLVVFDAAVNHGPQQAGLFLQRAVGIDAKGTVGPRTLAAVQQGTGVAEAVIEQRRAFYQLLAERKPSQRKFLKGWMNRLDRLAKEIA